MKKNHFSFPFYGWKFIFVPIFLAMLFGCSTNPVTNRRELMLVSENREFEIGRKLDKSIREEMGVYLELPELRVTVKDVVNSLGQSSDRSALIYRVEIIDTPDFNAFAVPGGFLYVHRGLLERINSMDDLAAVMGHEIAHVAARHSAAQISKMELLNYGLFGLSVATGGAPQKYEQLIDLGAALSFSKFSRDDEREADHFGTTYMVNAGYNPKAAIDVMKQIDTLQTREPSALAVWFMTHPPTDERIENLTQEIEHIRAMHPQLLDKAFQRNEYIQLLDGMAVGQWNGKELTKGDRYYNREFLFSIPVPPGWEVQINPKNATAVFSDINTDSYDVISVEPLQKKTNPEAYFKTISDHLKGQGLKPDGPPVSADRYPKEAVTGIFRSSQKQAILIVFLSGDNGFSMLGVSSRDAFKEISPHFEAIGKGFEFISADQAASLAPPRLRIHRVAAGDTWEKIARAYFGETDDKKKLAEYNGLPVEVKPEQGTLLKIPPTLRFR